MLHEELLTENRGWGNRQFTLELACLGYFNYGWKFIYYINFVAWTKEHTNCLGGDGAEVNTELKSRGTGPMAYAGLSNSKLDLLKKIDSAMLGIQSGPNAFKNILGH